MWLTALEHIRALGRIEPPPPAATARRGAEPAVTADDRRSR